MKERAEARLKAISKNFNLSNLKTKLDKFENKVERDIQNKKINDTREEEVRILKKK